MFLRFLPNPLGQNVKFKKAQRLSAIHMFDCVWDNPLEQVVGREVNEIWFFR